MKHSKMSASYDHINTPFYQSNGVITQLGRVRLRIVSGEKMRTALETASFAQLNIKKTTQQRSAIHAARKVIDSTFLNPDWKDPEAMFKMVQALDDENDSFVKTEKSTGETTDDDSELKDSSTEEEIIHRFNCHRLLILVAEHEIERLYTDLRQNGGTDKLITTLKSLDRLRPNEGAFLTLLRSFVQVLPQPRQTSQLVLNSWSLLRIKQDKPLTADFVTNALIDVTRFFGDMDTVLATIGIPPLTDGDKYIQFTNMVAGTTVHQQLEEYEGHALRSNREPELEEMLAELMAWYQRKAFTEETSRGATSDDTSRGSTADGSTKAKAIVVGNVGKGKGKQGGKDKPKSKSKDKAKPSKYTPEERSKFDAWKSRNPGVCVYCEEKGDVEHFRNCDRKKPIEKLATDNPVRLMKEAQGSGGSGGVFTCRPMTVYRASPSVGQSNTILDTGAASGSYVSIDKGFDARTVVSANSLIKGIGGGKARVSKAGTVYIRVPGRVCLANGQFEARRVNIRYDAAYAPGLDEAQTNLIGTSSLVYDGGVVAIKAAAVAEFGKQTTHTPQGDQLLHLGAVHAITDRVQRVEIRLTARDGLLYFPSFEYLTQGEIEALEPNPPKALTQLGPMLEDMDQSDSESD